MEVSSNRKMPISIQALFDALAEICDEKALRVSTVSSLQGAAITGISTFLGGLLGGPRGLALGGMAGGFLAAAALNDFKPVSKVLQTMDHEKKQKLIQKLKLAFKDFGITDITNIALLILSQQNLKELALREVTDYVTKDLGLRLA